MFSSLGKGAVLIPHGEFGNIELTKSDCGEREKLGN